MKQQAAAVPQAEVALDDPGTQQALRAATKLLWLRFAKWFGGSAVVGGGVWLTQIDQLALIGVAAFFTGAPAFFMHCDSLVCLRRVKRVLRLYPWEYGSVARKLAGGSRHGLFVKVHTDRGGWSPELLACNFRSPTRWNKELEEGLWFAGDMSFGGVFGLPGGGEFTAARPRYIDELTAERGTADDTRQELAKQAGLIKN